MQDPELAIQELQRCKEIGLAGVEIGSHVNDWNLNDPNILPVFEACQDLDMCVFIHPWDMIAGYLLNDFWWRV
jgi:aminocarboxymuconate-semialdehyde decarboxylase